jgi:hypothetical protein
MPNVTERKRGTGGNRRGLLDHDASEIFVGKRPLGFP